MDDSARCRLADPRRRRCDRARDRALEPRDRDEAGVFTLDGAARLLAAPWAPQITRVLVEVIYEHDDTAAVALAREIDQRVAVLERPRLWHGDAQANWAVVDAGLAAGVDVRVGLEDTLIGRDGKPAPGNAAQVAATFC